MGKEPTKLEVMAKQGYVTVAEACTRAGCSPGVIYRALERGLLDGCEYLGQKFVREASLKRFTKPTPINGKET